jgi:mannitol/fructose-specific phosphotransferase system IIA component (Ntr-type)
LDRELREIMKERDPREADPFDELLTGARVLDVAGAISFVDLAKQASERLALELPVSATTLAEGFLEGTRMGATPVSHGAALPHMRSKLLDRSYIALVRVSGGVSFEGETDETADASEEPIRAVFFLVSPEANPGQHLRILARIARRVDQESFMSEWLGAESDEQLKEALFRNERIMVLTLARDQANSTLIGLRIRDVSFPDGTLIAMIRRENQMVIPAGDTELIDGDRLTVIGRPEGISALRKRYGVAAPA